MFHFMQLLSAETTIFQKKSKCFFAPDNMKKPPSKVAHNHPKFFFSVLPTSQKPDQISDIFHRNLPLRDFSIMTLIIHTYMQTIDSFYSYSTYSVKIFSEVTLLLTFNKICFS